MAKPTKQMQKAKKPEPVKEPSEVSEQEMSDVEPEVFDEDPFASSDEEAAGSDLLGDSDEDGSEGDFDQDGSDDEGADSDSDDEKLNFKDIEKKSKKIQQIRQDMEEDAAEEMQIGARSHGADVLDFVKAGENVAITDLTQVKSRIADLVLLLENFNKEVGQQVARSDLIAELAQRCTVYYGYNEELTEYFFRLLPPAEAVAWFESNESARPVTIRTNTLKTHRRELAAALIDRGADVDPLDSWSKEGLKVTSSSVPIGATPEYLAGQYLLQSASSFVPVLALKPLPGEKILDMAAAPGGKATHIGQLMRNKGTLFVNDFKKQRCSSMIANIHRLGITNTVVINMDGRRLPAHLSKLDRVLLDAPCSGVGIVARDKSVKLRRTPKDFAEHSALQKELLSAAIDMVDANSRTGGYVVYSTCSVAVEENEEVVNHVLKTRNVELVPLGLDGDVGDEGLTKFGEHRFDPSLKLTRRLYPHKHNMDGFYVAKLKKISNEIPERARKDRRKHNIPEWDADTMKAAADGFLSFDNDAEEVAAEAAAPKKEKKKPVEGGAVKLSLASVSKVNKKAAAAAEAVESSEDEEPTKAPAAAGKKEKKDVAVPQIWGKKQKKKLTPEEVAARLAPKGQKTAAAKAAAQAQGREYVKPAKADKRKAKPAAAAPKDGAKKQKTA